MKRSRLIFLLGLLLAIAAYCAFYFSGTAERKKLLHSETPELAWLKTEFKLSDAEFTKVCQLHFSYTPHCEEMCRRIEKVSAELSQLVTQSNAVTPEIEKKMEEAAELRLECQKMMLAHFYEVSLSMPPEQGKRYLTMMQRQTSLSSRHTP